jgi:drug/metabolite transporter (DMT)-like permease
MVLLSLVKVLINKSYDYLIKTLIFTVLALVAFAANSVLCRLALGENTIDASSFTVLRLLSGTLVLLAILQIHHTKNKPHSKGSWTAGIMLFLYAITFSFSYITLDTGTGALILFGSVQITMIFLSIISGNRLHITEWMGVSISFAGFVYLILPGVTTPSVTGFLLMTVAGIAWGIYTLRGRGSDNPLMDTTYNFLRTIPLVILLAIVTIQNTHYSTEVYCTRWPLSDTSGCSSTVSSSDRSIGRNHICIRGNHTSADAFSYHDTRRNSIGHFGTLLFCSD